MEQWTQITNLVINLFFIKNQNVKITKDFVDTIINLEKRAVDLNLAPIKNVSVLDRIRTDLMLYELNTDFRNALKSLGFDSIKYLNEAEPSFKGESPFSYILFEPNQFKLTGSAKFDTDDPRQAFVIGGIAKVLAPKLSSGFFSAAHKAALKLEGSKPKAGQSFINQIKKPFWLINTARGKSVATADLVSALKSDKILGAGLDVLEYEKASFETLFSSELPEAFRYLINSEKVLLSPHVAGWTIESKEKLAQTIVDKIKTKFY